MMEDDNKNTASDIVFASAYKISEDMLKLVHTIVGSHNTFEKDFTVMAEQFEDLATNLQEHVDTNQLGSRKDRDEVERKIHQARYLMDMCLAYATAVSEMANRIVTVTEGLESEKQMKPITDNLILFMEKDQPAAESDDSEDDTD
jgi:small-conductance mechanosensitive channel